MVENKDEEEVEEDDFEGNDSGSVLEDLDWRVAKLKLEENNTKRFLKAKPRYLPYAECRKWVAAWNRWETAEEW